MTRPLRLLARLLVLALALAGPLHAVQPDEVLPDAVLEARAREISQTLRCPVCQGENIDESNAPISRDLRLAVRERLVAGDSDAQVVDYIVRHFGEFVLFKPRASGANLILWLAGPALLLIALGLAFAYLRRRAATPEAAVETLSAEEQARLHDILDR